METTPEPGRPAGPGDEAGVDDAGSGPGSDPDSGPDAERSEPSAGAAGEGGIDPDAGDAGKDPLRFNKWMKRSATGAVMTGIAIGLREALEPRRPEVGFVIEASDPDEPDGPIELRFDPDSPQNTVAVIRRPTPEPEADDGSRRAEPPV